MVVVVCGSGTCIHVDIYMWRLVVVVGMRWWQVFYLQANTVDLLPTVTYLEVFCTTGHSADSLLGHAVVLQHLALCVWCIVKCCLYVYGGVQMFRYAVVVFQRHSWNTWLLGGLPSELFIAMLVWHVGKSCVLSFSTLQTLLNFSVCN